MGGTGGTPTEPQVSSVAITTGTHTISWSAASSGTTTSAFAMTMHDPFGNLVFDTTNPVYYSTFATPTGVVSEIIMPGGGAWFTGVTQVKLGQDASTVSNFYAGSTINITSKYVYEITVAATYVPPPPAPSGGGGNGGYRCVVATTLADQNDGWSNRDMLRLMSWSFKKLDKSFLGKRLHKGYQVIGPKLLVPIVRKKGTLLSKYIKWSFTNATNMLQGKKFNPISVVNTVPWLILMTTIGLIVTEEYATKSRQALGLRKK
jgi:hypothetical protein